jgi:broad specificity phosphatase PhoE
VRSSPGGVPITVIYASPARRARETIAPLTARLGLSIHILTDLRERALCHGAVDDFFRATMPDIYAFHVSVDNKASVHRLWE